ncbi:hypothetical protein [Streptomyces sp. NPDC096132]|uniref:hypothetical protein n=1 Tax=Streptomyces sp. NPDC096132 TaxID=3366075 RepID=UPI00380FA3B5
MSARVQGADEPVVVVAQVVPDVHAGEPVGDVRAGVVAVHQVGEHLLQRPRLRVGTHQGDVGPEF